MAVKKLSSNIQCLFSSSVHIFSHKRAIEELVYNALDAQSTSIAIRLHIEENKIQVVDNGNGITKDNFALLGQNYATSKFVDITRYKSTPNSYGFRGQCLASLVEVSKCVKITSRVVYTEETWTKTFIKGNGKQPTQTSTRSSKGTTVEVNGFLYNLNIQNKGINAVIEMNEIKTLLEQLSLVHNNVSFSLRDDSKNEIIFKAYKNSDMYQTVKSLFDIDKSDIQELQIEKNEYKIKAYVAKNNDHPDRHHWIFLNKKFVNSTKLQKLVHDNLTKALNPSRRRTKLKKNKHLKAAEDEELSNNHVSFYFIFITCPYYDYDISSTPRQSTLEFKDWGQITKLVEKLVKFYTGELKVKEVRRTDIVANKEKLQDKNKIDESRRQVREIMKKILGSNAKKVSVSQMQNGIKGKLIKRKKNKLTKPKLSISKVIPPKEQKMKHNAKSNDNKVEEFNLEDRYTNMSEKARPLHRTLKTIETHDKKTSRRNKIIHNHKINISSKVLKKKKKKKDPLVEIFKKQPDIVVQRCNSLAQEANKLILQCSSNRKQRVFVNETVNYSNIVTGNKNISTRQRVEEMIIYDYFPINSKEKKLDERNDDNNLGKPKKTDCFKTSYDLLRTIIGADTTCTQNLLPSYDFHNDREGKPDNCKMTIPQLTYQSHHYVSNKTVSQHYERNENMNHFNHFNQENNFKCIQPSDLLSENKNSTVKFNQHKLLCDIDASDYNKIKPDNKQIFKKSKLPDRSNFYKQFNIRSFSDKITSLTIDFSNSEDNNEKNFRGDYSSANDVNRSYEIPITNFQPESTCSVVTTTIGFTYTIATSSSTSVFQRNPQVNDEYCNSGWSTRLTRSKSEEVLSNQVNNTQNDKLNVIFISNSNDVNYGNFHRNEVEPLNFCETILGNSDNQETTSEKNYDQNQLDSLFNLTFKEISSDVRIFDVGDTQQLLQLSQNESVASEKTVDRSHSEIIGTNRNVIVNNNSNKQMDLHKIDDVNNLEEVVKKTEETEKEDTERVLIAKDFDIRNRPRFLPKGMSPIFENRCVKTKQDGHNAESGYFADELYHKFRDEVQTNSEVYEADVKNPKDFASHNIVKVNYRLEKDNSSLTFNAKSLTEAKILGQIDNKFIATIVKGKSEHSEFLVLFDQHAVHERIRLEENLADYFNNNKWKIIKLDDDILFKLSKEEIIYLHNYKDKFTQFGLDWTIQNNYSITLHGIPAAILGKNPRPAEKVIIAVKNLISEEIDMIRSQKGCTSSYPKSIMELVFSEACRYAIKFGDRLPQTECVRLIKALSKCKTPFQCAHGRPVMAVIMDIKQQKRNYQINRAKLRQLAHGFKK